MLETPLRHEVSNAEPPWLYQYIRNYPNGQKVLPIFSTKKENELHPTRSFLKNGDFNGPAPYSMDFYMSTANL